MEFAQQPQGGGRGHQALQRYTNRARVVALAPIRCPGNRGQPLVLRNHFVATAPRVLPRPVRSAPQAAFWPSSRWLAGRQGVLSARPKARRVGDPARTPRARDKNPTLSAQEGLSQCVLPRRAAPCPKDAAPWYKIDVVELGPARRAKSLIPCRGALGPLWVDDGESRTKVPLLRAHLPSFLP